MSQKPNVHYFIEKNYLTHPRQFATGKLYQIGKMHCGPQHVIPKHAHLNWFELTLISDGRGTVITNDVPVSVSAGDIYLSYPGEFHCMTADRDDPMKYRFFAFYPSDPKVTEALEEIMSTHFSPESRVFRDERIRYMLGIMLSEITDPDEYSEEQFASMLYQIPIYIIRNFKSESEKGKEQSIGSAEEFCYRVMNHIDTHLYTMEKLSELSALTHYNYSYISALYKSTTGETLQSYYRRRRMEAARLLLTENNFSVTRVSELLHFSSIYTFSRAYKDYFGVSPSCRRQ